MKRWGLPWRDLPPVADVDRSGPPLAPVVLDEQQKRIRLRQYERTHLEHVVEAQARRREED